MCSTFASIGVGANRSRFSTKTRCPSRPGSTLDPTSPSPVAAKLMFYPSRFLLALSGFLAIGSACAGRVRPEPVESPLALDSVVLYRSGVGYFERHGEIDGDTLTLRVRKDQIDDLLKSLTVVDRKGRPLSISMPLDPQSWSNAAMATLAPGEGSLAEVLDALRGVSVRVKAKGGRHQGRIVLIEEVINEPSDASSRGDRSVAQIAANETRDYRLTLLDGERFRVVRLSEIESVELADGDLAMQLHRSLDASAGEGMFEQVDVTIRLAGAKAHDLTVSYVVEAPMWKPTYRVVLPSDGSDRGLLQAWAVVDNVSGEDWNNVSLSLTSGAPIAFRYDLRTPRGVEREDLTERGVRRRARAAVGEMTFDDEMERGPAQDLLIEESAAAVEAETEAFADEEHPPTPSVAGGLAPAKKAKVDAKRSRAMAPNRRGESPPPAAPRPGEAPRLGFEQMQQSMLAKASTHRVSGLTRVDLDSRVTIPDGSSTMVAILNREVEADEAFLFKPGGAGVGYESNPYRVVRFRNDTEHVLEPGPISIFARGSFVGEGLSEVVGTRASVTIPFAVEPEIRVFSNAEHRGDELKIVKISRGVVEVESFRQTATTWTVKLPPRAKDTTVLIRHPRQGPNYELAPRPEGTEDLVDAYLIPVAVTARAAEAKLKVVEQTPSRLSLSIWDGQMVPLLDQLLVAGPLDETMRGRLDGIVSRRREIGRIDTEIASLQRQQRELDERAKQTRHNLAAIKKDPKAGRLRERLNRRLLEFTEQGDAIGRQIVDLASKRLEQKIELEDMLEEFEFVAPAR
ncbi:MAG: DUF4139 domain-containing protein [Myxococcales bacterium FL481]|nr:MAG: DUF4139 domain-containing protein [Myxococcales bacterium FL481]